MTAAIILGYFLSILVAGFFRDEGGLTEGQAWWVVVGGPITVAILLAWAVVLFVRWSLRCAVAGVRDTLHRPHKTVPTSPPDEAMAEIETWLQRGDP